MFIDTTIAFIGSGMMAEAMIRGLLSQKIVEPGQIIAAGPRPERAEKLRERHGIEATTDNRIAAEKGQIVILSVKPQVLNEVMPEIRGHLRRQDMVVSIIAGMPIEVIANGLAHAAVVRAMPNTPAQIGQGITVWTVTPEVSESQKQQAQAILGSLGQEVFVEDEDYLDMATALSGTGPAYVFLLMEAMIDAGVHMGFSRRISKQLVFQTMRGSVEFAARSDKHVAELRNQVTSPGGTSAEALYHMEKGGLRTVISRGIWAAYQRSIALGKGQKRGSVNGE
ncbi:MAG: pyrroline-5-carboxylate reductase [Anaerolineae bacterium SG8_19]|jgi:pyrroline-5-carboxylate reductase|nr:MAG: pyrroline-5-carboxylate reductase [Anaerolineae bacterium SG8_19]HCB49611.1 pyrroline-5-carboxylate reductase [Chloroflexota bacterium]